MKNEIYIGNTVQGKRRTKSYKIHKVEAVNSEEWIRVENTHEPIIDKETFEKAQELSKRDTRISQKTNELSIWAGLLKCADCKRAMNKKSSTNKSGKVYEYYICSTYRKKSNKLCTKHSIKIEVLERAVLKAINFHMDLLIDTEELVNQISYVGATSSRPKQIEKMINTKQKEISKISNFKRTLYEDWKNEYITKNEYLEYKKKYEEDLERLKTSIKNLEEEGKRKQKHKTIHNKWLEDLIENRAFAELSRDILLELVDYIYIHENGDITINFKFKK